VALERRLQPDSSDISHGKKKRDVRFNQGRQRYGERQRSPGSANTAMAVIGVDEHARKYLLDGFDHQMDLMERWHNLCDLRRKWATMPGSAGDQCQ
jgi:hypothetical protein